MQELVWAKVVARFASAYPGVGINSGTQVAFHQERVEQHFDGLLKGLLRQHNFAEMFFEFRAPSELRLLKRGACVQEVRTALEEIRLQLTGGALGFADGFGLKRANKGGKFDRGDEMLKRMGEELLAHFTRDLVGRKNIGDEFVFCSDGPPELVHAACVSVNTALSTYLVEDLPTRLDFGVAEYSVIAAACLELMDNGLGYDPTQSRLPSQHFYDVGLHLAVARSDIMKRYELLGLVWVSLKLMSLGKRTEADHQELISSLLRPGESVVLPDESWLSVPDDVVPVHARAQALAGLSLPEEATPYERIIHRVAEAPFLG